jgi:uncharacterized protein (UPF0332 family)
MEYSETELSKHRLNKAVEDLSAAKELFKTEKYAQSINRSYYAIFHSTRALLAFDRYDSKKHSGVIHFFHQNYIAANKIENHYGKILSMAFNIRVRADYHDFFLASKEDAVKQLNNAEDFINRIKSYLLTEMKIDSL